MEQQRVERKLAAIFAGDVAGYSRLMGQDEEGTLVRLKALRRQLVDPKLKEHHGRLVKTTGDGLLVEFASPVDAVRCAVEIQRLMVDRNAGLPPDRRIDYRIGINLGDVIADADDLYGDGVNVAARLEGLAEPGGICLSRAVRDQVRDRLPYVFEDLGEQSVKNIARPIRVFGLGAAAVAELPAQAPAAEMASSATAATSRRRLSLQVAALVVAIPLLLALAAAALVMLREPTAPTVAGKPSVAVLAFTNMSDDPKQDYFSDGIAEDLITDLSQISGLVVIARNSSFVYKGKPVSIDEVARALGVRYVLEGSVRRAGEQLRITAQLIDAATGAHVWAARYDRKMENIFALQDDVRTHIVAALAVKLSPREKRRLARQPTSDPVAYDYYTRGLQQESYFSLEANREARRMYEKATERDPKFAAAYSHLSINYSLEAERQGDPNSPLMLAAVSIAEQAAQLDPELPQTHMALGRALLFHGEVDRARTELEQAVAIDPNYADGYSLLGLVRILQGKAAEAVTNVERAQRINPVYPFYYLTVLGEARFHLGDYAAAQAALERAVERNPAWSDSRLILAATYVQLGRIDEARWQLDEIRAQGVVVNAARVGMFRPYQDQTYRNNLLQSLRKAGLPD